MIFEIGRTQVLSPKRNLGRARCTHAAREKAFTHFSGPRIPGETPKQGALLQPSYSRVHRIAIHGCEELASGGSTVALNQPPEGRIVKVSLKPHLEGENAPQSELQPRL